jgi:hypothetical protein
MEAKEGHIPPSDGILFILVCFSVGVLIRLGLKWTKIPYTAILLVRAQPLLLVMDVQQPGSCPVQLYAVHHTGCQQVLLQHDVHVRAQRCGWTNSLPAGGAAAAAAAVQHMIHNNPLANKLLGVVCDYVCFRS